MTGSATSRGFASRTLVCALALALVWAATAAAQGPFDRPLTPPTESEPTTSVGSGPAANAPRENVDQIRVDKPPSDPEPVAKPPPPAARAEAAPVPMPEIEAVAALPPKWRSVIATADRDRIEAIGQAVADNLKSKDETASKEFYRDISRAVLARSAALEREAAKPAQSAPGARPPISLGGCAEIGLCNDLQRFVSGLGGRRGTGTSGSVEDAATVGDAFFEGGREDGGVLTEAKAGTSSLEMAGDKKGEPIRDARDFEREVGRAAPGSRRPRAGKRRGSIGGRPPPPLPPGGAGSPGEEEKIVPKGVRISFQAATLGAAIRQGLGMAKLENRLIEARAPDDLVRAAHRSGAQASEMVLRRSGARRLDGVVLVSLRALAGGAEIYAGRWDDMPDEIRHPGPIRRIHGYIVEPDDIRLIATSDGDGAPLSLDEIAVAVEAIWWRGAEPIVSLDPDPNDHAGPQWSRVGGVPFDSVFAETMLEADYEMKFVSMLGRNVPFGGFRSVIQHIRSRGAIENSYSRFWFTPAPPAPGDILTTPDGAVYLYDGGVILDTEEMVVSAGALSGTGGRNPINETVARNFTEIYGEFEGAFPVFRRLHAVMDMSLTAALWRTTRLAHPVLRRLAALKVPPHPVRRSYKALFHQFSLRRGRALLAGGVNLAQQLVAGSVHAVDDRVVGVLLGAARRTRGVLSTRVEQVSLPVIPGRRRAGDAGDDPILRVNVILQSGDAERAYALADRLARRQPDRADLMALRVEAAIELGLYRLAEHDLRRIFQLTNAAEAVRQTAIRVRILEGRLTDFSRLSRADRRAVAGYFRTRGARLSVDAARRAEALEQAEIAVRLAPRVAENLAVRGSILLGMGRLSDAGADLEDAIRFKPRNAMFRILGARVALDTGEFAAAEQHLTVAIENATGLDVLKYITMRGIARGCIGADLATCKSIIRSVEQIAGPDPPKKPAPPDRARSRRR